jgi:hypothetical protein
MGIETCRGEWDLVSKLNVFKFKGVMRIILLLIIFFVQTFAYGQQKKAKEGDTITVVGIAYDVKGKAYVLTSDNTRYFIYGLDWWDKKYRGKKVKVIGVLKLVKHKRKKNNGNITLQQVERNWTERRLLNAKWEFFIE